MAPRRSRTKVERAKQLLKGQGAAALDSSDRDDSASDLSADDREWEWIYDDEGDDDGDAGRRDDDARPGLSASTKKSRPAPARRMSSASTRSIVGARKGRVECRIGDVVLLHNDSSQPWVALVCEFMEDPLDGDKMANFLWFTSPDEIRNVKKRRTDALPNERYITTDADANTLETINGKAIILSPQAFREKYPSGKIPRSSKGFGSVFVCRRGCNARTATFTEEFVWEDVYGGTRDIEALKELIATQTQATRKRKPTKRKASAGDLEDFVIPDDDDGNFGAPKTPRKKRKTTGALTPTPKQTTPRKFLTPTHKRIVVKKPLEFTPLGTRILSPHKLSSPFQQARTYLHVSAVPASLPCREDEFSMVYSYLETAITEGTGTCIYISGVPGTGKTATVREVVAQLNASVLAEELDDFVFVEINGMKVTDPHQSYSLLWEALHNERVSPTHALSLLEREFSTPSPRRVPCVVLMDELDQLVTRTQSVMYNFFNWPTLQHSRLIVLAVANTMDLPERTLSNKISSRLGLTRITFPGYTHPQLMKIIESRLQNAPDQIIHPDAIQFAARKVAAVSGDARRALDICRRAIEIAEADAAAREADSLDAIAPDTPSKHGRSGPGGASTTAATSGGTSGGMVTIATVKRAIAEATSSPLQQALRALPLAAKVFLAALLARVRRTGVAEAVLGDVLDEAARVAAMCALPAVQEHLQHERAWAPADEGRRPGRKGVGVAGAGGTGGAGDGTDDKEAPVAQTMELKKVRVGRLVGMEAAVVQLAEAGIVGLEARRGERVGRVRLGQGVGDEDVRGALKDDDEVKGLGFGEQ
ncbi:P-loop containing nucleoside triphosphate hydrolase protein [Lineolata rhizophorae]|uniref:Origin recognition complex subunit 1 n=1 Tax=Lineolata rhizophorae TaxID=578093 RepID=A0A6A6PAY4_9PEZI|nr:P-loop containing nucleoside triphosphate hydrolase protein [Lineolata rhizophorae]